MEDATIQQRLGAALRNRRETLHYSQESFADAIGMHRAYYSAIERGERNTTIATLAKVVEGLGTDIATLAKLARV